MEEERYIAYPTLLKLKPTILGKVGFIGQSPKALGKRKLTSY